MKSDNDLYRILADYSVDLYKVRKRNGKLPAEAAVERINANFIPKSDVIAAINKTRDIFLTKERVAKGDLGDDTIKHWDYLRAEIRKDLGL